MESVVVDLYESIIKAVKKIKKKQSKHVHTKDNDENEDFALVPSYVFSGFSNLDKKLFGKERKMDVIRSGNNGGYL